MTIDLQSGEVGRLTKLQLRTAMRRRRGNRSKRWVAQRSAEICQRFRRWSVYREASAVALYWPIPHSGEVDLRGLDLDLRRRGRQTYYPVFSPHPSRLVGFSLVRSRQDLVTSGHSFRQPNGAPSIGALGKIDLVIVPAVAATVRGERLGFGSGFYDQVLPLLHASARCAVVVFEFQLVGSFPVQPHDRKCDYLVTERRLLACAATDNGRAQGGAGV